MPHDLVVHLAVGTVLVKYQYNALCVLARVKKVGREVDQCL